MDEEIEEQDGESEDSAATSSAASASTRALMNETNDSPSAAEPAEVAGPTENDDDDVHPNTDADGTDES